MHELSPFCYCMTFNGRGPGWLYESPALSYRPCSPTVGPIHMNKAILLVLSLLVQIAPPAPVLPVPTPQQLEWQQLEYYAFIHFGINTFPDKEGGEGGVGPDTFTPAALDCRQWAGVERDAGRKEIIIKAKH